MVLFGFVCVCAGVLASTGTHCVSLRGLPLSLPTTPFETKLFHERGLYGHHFSWAGCLIPPPSAGVAGPLHHAGGFRKEP